MSEILMKRGEEAFSLIELLVAITVLAIGLLGIAGLQGATISKNLSAMKNTEATALIEDKIEEFRDTPYTSISEGTETESSLGTGGLFSRTSIIQDNIPLVDTKTITVQVSWSSPGQHMFTFQTIVSNPS